jgi:hypothetical protein
MALGGSYASGTDSFAAAIANNTSSYGATGANAVALGSTSLASASGAFAAGNTATASGSSSIALGKSAVASATGAVAVSGNGANWGVTASGVGSIALGDGAKSLQYGKFAHTGVASGAQGDTQRGIFVLSRSTTNATPAVLTSNDSTPGSTNQVILPNNSAYTVRGQIMARRSVAQADEASGWEFTAVIRRGANAASTTLVAAVTPTLIAQDAGLSTTVVAVTADTTNGGLAITVTGIAATNIRWIAVVHTAELTYA